MNLKNYHTMDIQLLLGLVNTALRNDCRDLDDLVKRHDLEEKVLRDRLESEIGMVYFADVNQFRPAQTENSE